MPSPFPGMNPYLEHPRLWQGFHQQFIAAACHALNARLGRDYIALVEEQVYITEVDATVARLAGKADVGIAVTGTGDTEFGTGDRAVGAATLAPVRVILPAADAESLSRLEVRRREGEELVTVIEVLSPTNKKAGWHRDQYVAKRGLLLNGDAHFVEIDLLRGWEPMPTEDFIESAYRILVSRAEERPAASLWPIGLREPLPTIPIPLRTPDADVPLDLQSVLHVVYDGGGYERLIYRYEPVPALHADHAQWAAEIVRREVAR